jgi:glutathione S-transferase
VAGTHAAAEEIPMPELVASASATVFVVCCAILCLEMTAFGVATAAVRQRRNLWLNEEDARRFSGTVADIEHRDVARLLRVHRNQLENVVPFFALGLLWVATGAPSRFGAALFIGFTVSRILHPVFYLARMGRLRTAGFTLGFGVLVILSGGLIWRSIVAALG